MAKEGLIGGENENHEDDVLNRNANQINVSDEGDDADVEMDHRPPNEDKRVALERKRRRIETQLYADLRDLLPNLPPKVYKSTILDEAMDSIKELKQTLHNLKEEKMKRLHTQSTNTSMATLVPSHSLVANNESPFITTEKGASMNLGTISYQSSNIFKTWASSNVTLSVCGTDAIINICSLKDPELFTKVCFILETHNLEIIYAQISSDHAKTMYMIRARGIVPPELENGVPYEEMCKRAVAQIVQCVKF